MTLHEYCIYRRREARKALKLTKDRALKERWKTRIETFTQIIDYSNRVVKPSKQFDFSKDNINANRLK